MTWHLSLDNIAGIRHGNARIRPGVNVVRASNWQGKSSFLAGIETACGVATPLTEGADSGRVEVTTDEGTFAVDLVRTNGSVSRRGTPLLDEESDRVCADLFAFLDEDNAVRRAVRNGENLRDLLTRPLDFENIDEQIADLRAERDRVENELDRATAAADELPRLHRRVTALEDELDELRSERADVDALDGSGDDRRERLSDLRAERDQVDARIERLETTVERLRERIADARSERESLSVPAEDTVESDLESARQELRDVERDRELLQSVFEANKRVLDEGRIELLTDVSHEVLTDAVACWLCGQESTREEMEDRLTALDSRISDLRETAASYRERVDDLEARREEVRRARRREQDLEDRIAELRSRLAAEEESLDAARDRRADLQAHIEDLATEVDTAADRAADLESEIKYTKAELADVRDDLETAESRAERRESLSAKYDSLTADIEDLRNRKDELRRRTRGAFSTALEEILERFDTGFETARLTSTFDLVVAREGREAGLDALSEGERELLGFVAALAGHEAFDVGDRVPVMLLDGLGGLASDNLVRFVDYVAERSEYLVLTAYPEHADFDGHELSPSEWDVVSHGSDASAAS